MTHTSEAQAALKVTPLHGAHLRAGARMVPFGGWDMPVQYAGVKAEHEAVRGGVGVFDVSHMGQFRVRGEGALAFLQFMTPNDVSKLRPGRAQYNWLPNDRGGLVDDIYIYMAAQNDYLLVVNAGNVDKDWAHLAAHAAEYGAELTNESERWALLAVQGPAAAQTLQPHLNVDLGSKKKNAYFPAQLFGFDVFLARTGYTGEDGFEVFCDASEAETLWDKLLAVGIQPCGLGARDTLRLEAGFPLYGHEFGEDIHPLSSHYSWVVKDKPFYGREALERPPTQRLIGLRLERVPAREGYPVHYAGEVVGHVTSGTMSPSLGYPIALALVRADVSGHNTFEVEVRGKPQPATRVDVPFYPGA